MEFLRKIESRREKNGHLVKWAIFWCNVCLQEVERRWSDGLKDKSCGCSQYTENDGINNPNYKHGETGIKLYKVWKSMKQRILNSNNKDYKDYGGRSITVCNEWLEFIPFRDWALNNGYQEGLEIDRRNTNGNYEPSNCRWITHEENMRNIRTKKIKNMGQADEIRELNKTGKYTRKELSIKYNVSKVVISNIINNKTWKIKYE